MSSLTKFANKETWFTQRDDIKHILVNHLKTQTTQYWLDILEPQDIWCAAVLDWDMMFAHEGFQVLDMVQEVARDENVKLQTLRCPIRIDGERLFANQGAPRIGQQTKNIMAEFKLV